MCLVIFTLTYNIKGMVTHVLFIDEYNKMVPVLKKNTHICKRIKYLS